MSSVCKHRVLRVLNGIKGTNLIVPGTSTLELNDVDKTNQRFFLLARYQNLVNEISFQQSPNLEKEYGNPFDT